MSVQVAAVQIGSRQSALARRQAELVIERLRAAWPHLDCRTVFFTTSGDRRLDTPLPEIGGKGVFTQEIQDALRSGAIDLAVHSLKDLPIDDIPDLVLGAICARDDARDVLISADGRRLADLAAGARVGTSSLRRSAQLLAARPDLKPTSVRGNVDTRIRKVRQGELEAAVLAAAGVRRLGLDEHVAEYLSFDVMLPAPGQGALAVECRAADTQARELLNAIDDPISRAAVTAEREFLRGLGGGCAAPVAAHARVEANGVIHLTGLVASTDGRRVVRVSAQGSDPLTLGAALAAQALEQGARALIAPDSQ